MTNNRQPEPVVHDTTVIGLGEYNDLQACLSQAVDLLAHAEHDAGWIILETLDVELLHELAEAVVLGCEKHLPKGGANA
jgi:hypothetical protein